MEVHLSNAVVIDGDMVITETKVVDPTKCPHFNHGH